MKGDRAVIEARLRGVTPAALIFTVLDGSRPVCLGDIEVSPLEDPAKLDLRFAFRLPVCVSGFFNEDRALRLYDALTRMQPTRAIFCSPTRLLEWTPDEGEIEWAA